MKAEVYSTEEDFLYNQLAASVGVQHFPPFLFMGLRQTVAGLLLLCFVMLSGKKQQLNWTVFRLQLVPGICMITFGNGVVGWAVQYIPSSIAALICSMIPLYVILLNLLMDKKEHVNRQIILGTLLGMAGIVLIFRDHLAELHNTAYLSGILITIASCILWAGGTIYTQRNKSASDPALNASIQLFIGGSGLLLMSLLFEGNRTIPTLSPEAMFAWIYLVLFGSVAAFAAYLYALSKLPVALVTVYAYINPLVAVVLGFLLLNEQINTYTILAALVIISGVYLVNSGYKLQQHNTQNKIQ